MEPQKLNQSKSVPRFKIKAPLKKNLVSQELLTSRALEQDSKFQELKSNFREIIESSRSQKTQENNSERGKSRANEDFSFPQSRVKGAAVLTSSTENLLYSLIKSNMMMKNAIGKKERKTEGKISPLRTGEHQKQKKSKEKIASHEEPAPFLSYSKDTESTWLRQQLSNTSGKWLGINLAQEKEALVQNDLFFREAFIKQFFKKSKKKKPKTKEEEAAIIKSLDLLNLQNEKKGQKLDWEDKSTIGKIIRGTRSSVPSIKAMMKGIEVIPANFEEMSLEEIRVFLQETGYPLINEGVFDMIILTKVTPNEREEASNKIRAMMNQQSSSLFSSLVKRGKVNLPEERNDYLKLQDWLVKFIRTCIENQIDSLTRFRSSFLVHSMFLREMIRNERASCLERGQTLYVWWKSLVLTLEGVFEFFKSELEIIDSFHKSHVSEILKDQEAKEQMFMNMLKSCQETERTLVQKLEDSQSRVRTQINQWRNIKKTVSNLKIQSSVMKDKADLLNQEIALYKKFVVDLRAELEEESLASGAGGYSLDEIWRKQTKSLDSDLRVISKGYKEIEMAEVSITRQVQSDSLGLADIGVLEEIEMTKQIDQATSTSGLVTSFPMETMTHLSFFEREEASAQTQRVSEDKEAQVSAKDFEDKEREEDKRIEKILKKFSLKTAKKFLLEKSETLCQNPKLKKLLEIIFEEFSSKNMSFQNNNINIVSNEASKTVVEESEQGNEDQLNPIQIPYSESAVFFEKNEKSNNDNSLLELEYERDLKSRTSIFSHNFPESPKAIFAPKTKTIIGRKSQFVARSPTDLSPKYENTKRLNSSNSEDASPFNNDPNQQESEFSDHDHEKDEGSSSQNDIESLHWEKENKRQELGFVKRAAPHEIHMSSSKTTKNNEEIARKNEEREMKVASFLSHLGGWPASGASVLKSKKKKGFVWSRLTLLKTIESILVSYRDKMKRGEKLEESFLLYVYNFLEAKYTFKDTLKKKFSEFINTLKSFDSMSALNANPKVRMVASMMGGPRLAPEEMILKVFFRLLGALNQKGNVDWLQKYHEEKMLVPFYWFLEAVKGNVDLFEGIGFDGLRHQLDGLRVYQPKMKERQYIDFDLGVVTLLEKVQGSQTESKAGELFDFLSIEERTFLMRDDFLLIMDLLGNQGFSKNQRLFEKYSEIVDIGPGKLSCIKRPGFLKMVAENNEIKGIPLEVSTSETGNTDFLLRLKKRFGWSLIKCKGRQCDYVSRVLKFLQLKLSDQKQTSLPKLHFLVSLLEQLVLNEASESLMPNSLLILQRATLDLIDQNT